MFYYPVNEGEKFMSNYACVNCPYCNFLFKFKKEKSEDDISILLTCPSCYREFGITNGPPLDLMNLVENPIDLLGGITAPVDSEPLFQKIGLPVVDIEYSDVSDEDRTEVVVREEKEEVEKIEEQTKEEENSQPLTL